MKLLDARHLTLIDTKRVKPFGIMCSVIEYKLMQKQPQRKRYGDGNRRVRIGFDREGT